MFMNTGSPADAAAGTVRDASDGHPRVPNRWPLWTLQWNFRIVVETGVRLEPS